MFRSTGYQRCR